MRQFEADFRELQATLDQHLKTIEEMTEVGETQARVEQLLCDTSAFQRICRVCTFIFYTSILFYTIKQNYFKLKREKISIYQINIFIYLTNIRD